MQITKLRTNAAYHQYWLEWGSWDADPPPIRSGNGLVWASEGRIVVFTGVDSGDVPLTVTLSDAAPPADPSTWDEVVEVSSVINAASVSVTAPDAIHIGEVPLPEGPGVYRLRFHARGRDAGEEAEFIDADQGEEMVEEHMIILWKAPATAEAQLKLTDGVGSANRSLS